MNNAAKPLHALTARFRAVRGTTRPSNPLRRFTYVVALPAFVVYLGVSGLMLLALFVMSAEINAVEADRNRSAIAAAVESLQLGLEDGAADEATWTEAYLNTYIAPNPAWQDATWGATARISENYDTAVVTDVDGKIEFGETSRGPITGKLADHFSGTAELSAELDAAVAKLGDDATVSGLARNDLGVVAIAGAVVHGNTGQASIARAQRRILWLARQIDTELLRATAERFELPQPHLAEHEMATGESMPLLDAANMHVATIAWEPRRPGDTAYAHTASIASLVMVVLGILTFAVLAAFRASIKSRVESDERDWYNARYDEVTGLYNRFGLEENLRSLLPKKRLDLPVSVAQIGVDGFIEVVGTYGRETGDLLLDALADRIELITGGQTALARCGPAEFTLARAGDAGATLMRGFAAKLLAMAGDAVTVGELKIKTGLSIGLAEAVATRDSLGIVLGMAETALARARETGGGHLVEYTSSIEDERRRRLDLQADLRRGLEADEFDLEYQPIIDFSTRSVIGVEALLRWNRRAAGPIGPGDFIPAAESSGLIDELGMFALRRAIAEIQPLGEIKLSVNVSPVQLRNPNLATTIIEILEAAEMPAARLQLEVTETFLVAHPTRAKRALEALRERGISIALDDFGTGYSSIGYLQQFEFDRLKLDRSLVEDIDSNPVQGALVESTMLYAYAMGLAVTAEGVERREEASVLARFGCREFQGYLFARPMPLEPLARLISEGGQLKAG